MNNSLRIVVVMGGPSAEHAISLRSGQGVAGALARRGVAVEPISIPQALTIEQASVFARRAIEQAGAEVVFIALHGAFGEDGTIQQVCDELQVAYTGSGQEASRLGMDKIASRRRFEQAGLRVPVWRIAALQDAGVSLPKGWSYPLVVKPSDQGSSIGVSLVAKPEELPGALAAAARAGRQVILEEFVAGREVTVGILGEEPLPVVEIRPHQPFFDFTAKYTRGATDYQVPADLPPDVAKAAQTAALEAHRVLGCRHLSRADLILTDTGTPVLLEVNTIPGFTPTSLLPKAAACAGISYEELCERLVAMARSGDRAWRAGARRAAYHPASSAS